MYVYKWSKFEIDLIKGTGDLIIGEDHLVRKKVYMNHLSSWMMLDFVIKIGEFCSPTDSSWVEGIVLLEK